MSMTDCALIVCAKGTSCAISTNFTSATYKPIRTEKKLWDTSTEHTVLAVLYCTLTGKNPSSPSPAILNSNRPFSTLSTGGLHSNPAGLT